MKKNKRKKSKIKRYGRFKTVILSDKEYNEIVNIVDDIDYWIKILDEYIQHTGTNYSSHRRAILRWFYMEKEEPEGYSRIKEYII